MEKKNMNKKSICKRYVPVGCRFDTKFDTYIIAYCPDTNSWFVTNERFFFYEYEKEFKTEEDAVEFLKENVNLFFDLEKKINSSHFHSKEIGIYLENTKELIQINRRIKHETIIQSDKM